MKHLVSVLSESPLYFTMALRDRYELLKRLQAREQALNLIRYQLKVGEFLNQAELGQPESQKKFSP